MLKKGVKKEDGVYDRYADYIYYCTKNQARGWCVGGDMVSFFFLFKARPVHRQLWPVP